MRSGGGFATPDAGGATPTANITRFASDGSVRPVGPDGVASTPAEADLDDFEIEEFSSLDELRQAR